MDGKDIHSELASIRALMEKSTKFLSLSGLSGVLAGIYALLGGWMASQWLYRTDTSTVEITWRVSLIALVVLLVSVANGILLTIRQARKNGEAYWNPVSRRLMSGMMIPLVTGGLFILLLLWKGEYHLVVPCCLIFYGLALISASQYSFSAVKWLGFLEIALGLLSTAFPAYGLLFWLTGFGVLHIIYGLWMHLNYNR